MTILYKLDSNSIIEHTGAADDDDGVMKRRLTEFIILNQDSMIFYGHLSGVFKEQRQYYIRMTALERCVELKRVLGHKSSSVTQHMLHVEI